MQNITQTELFKIASIFIVVIFQRRFVIGPNSKMMAMAWPITDMRCWFCQSKLIHEINANIIGNEGNEQISIRKVLI